MKRHANATLIGAFVVVGLALVAAGVIAAAGGKLFTRTEQAVMHFNGSIYGLQVGAPVVLRGVRVGSVASIGLVFDPATGGFLIPVVASLERDVIRSLPGPAAAGAAAGADASSDLTLPALVARGLRAQLSMQSLLTGQLYIDLDLRPGGAARLHAGGTGSGNGGRVEIPTSSTAIQNLKEQLEGLDMRRLLDDVSAIASSARAVVAGPELKQAMGDLTQITGQVRRLTDALARRVDPLAQAAQTTLTDGQRTMGRLSDAADRVGDAARRVAGSADRVGALAAPDSALLQRVQQTADELARSAAALRSQTSEGAPLVQNLTRALQDVSQASRAVRELADLLARQPDALLRGRSTEPTSNPGTQP